VPQDLQTIVQRMVEAGESEDDIALVIQHYKPAAAAESGPQPLPKQAPGTMMGPAGLVPKERRGEGLSSLLRLIRDNPVEASAMGGAMLAAPLTGGASIPAGMAAAGLGAAGGAGLAITGRQIARGTPEPAAQTLGTMAKQGAVNAAGEGIGRGVSHVASKAAPLVARGVLKLSKSLQREHGADELTGAFLKERVPVGKSSDVGQRAKESAGEVDALLAAKDAERPTVAGYLPPARETVPLGNPQTTMPKGTGVMVGKVIDEPGRGAYPGQVDPREILTGLRGAKTELGNRALNTRALGELSDLEREFLASHLNPMSLTETQALKRAEQKLADRAFRAQDAGNPINEVSANFHRGMASGARGAIERQVPQVGPMNARTQLLGGLEEALTDAEMRSPGFMGTNPVTWLGAVAPGTGSRLAFGLDRMGQGAPSAAAIRAALLSLLAGESQEPQ
jgi:hypothetical protein